MAQSLSQTFLFMQSLNLFQFIIFQHQRRKSAEGLLHQVHRHLVPRLHLLHLLLPHGVRPCQHHLAQEVSIIIIVVIIIFVVITFVIIILADIIPHRK